MNHAFNNLPPFLTIYRPFFGCAHRCVLRLAPLCRYPNTHPNPLQNPIGVCVPVYKFVSLLVELVLVVEKTGHGRVDGGWAETVFGITAVAVHNECRESIWQQVE